MANNSRYSKNGKKRYSGKRAPEDKASMGRLNGVGPKLSEKDQVGAAAPKTNDPAWYRVFPTLTKDAAELVFNMSNGIDFDTQTKDVTVDGAIIDFIPTVGVCKDPTDPVNMLAKSLYAQIRKENSGAKNYSSLVPIMYLLAVDSLYMYIEWAKRLYSEVFTSTPFNRSFPGTMLAAENINYLDLKDNIADFRKHIDWMIHMTSTFVVPKDIWLIQRHRQLVGNIYLDDPSQYAQSYIFHPYGFYQWDSANNKLKFLITDLYDSLGNGLVYADIVKLGVDLINAFVSMPDTSLLAGDIMKAYGQVPSEYASFVADNPEPIAVYDEEVLDMIHNISLFGLASMPANTFDITANLTNETLVFDPTLNCFAGFGYNQPDYEVLDLQFKDESDPEYNMAVTRGMAAYELAASSTTSAPKIKLKTLGTELFGYMRIVVADSGSPSGYRIINVDRYTGVQTANTSSAVLSQVASTGAALSKLNHHPKVTFTGRSNATPPVMTYVNYQMWDTRKKALIATDVLKRIHEAALWNVLSVPRS